MGERVVEQFNGTGEVFELISFWMPRAGWRCCDLLTEFVWLDGQVRAQHGPNPEHSKVFARADKVGFMAWLSEIHARSGG